MKDEDLNEVCKSIVDSLDQVNYKLSELKEITTAIYCLDTTIEKLIKKLK
jgi:hypothetical protein